MTQASPTIAANTSGLAYRQADNDAKQAILSRHKGSTAPTYAVAGMQWIDDSATPWVLKTFDGSDWITEGEIDPAADTFTPSNAVSENDLKGTAREYTKAQNFDAQTLTDGANISWNLEDNQVAQVTLGGNRTLDNPTNMKDGGVYILRVIQDGTGSRTLSFGTAYEWSGGTAPDLTGDANAEDIITFISDGSKMKGVLQGDFS